MPERQPRVSKICIHACLMQTAFPDQKIWTVVPLGILS